MIRDGKSYCFSLLVCCCFKAPIRKSAVFINRTGNWFGTVKVSFLMTLLLSDSSLKNVESLTSCLPRRLLPSFETRKDLGYNNIRTRCGMIVSTVSGRRHYDASKFTFLCASLNYCQLILPTDMTTDTLEQHEDHSYWGSHREIPHNDRGQSQASIRLRCTISGISTRLDLVAYVTL